MATPQQKLADALDTLRTLQDRNLVAIRSDDLSRPQRELLMKQGFLQEVMKGWYIRPASFKTPRSIGPLSSAKGTGFAKSR